MNGRRNWTAVFLVVVIAVLLGWEVWSLVSATDPVPTISSVIWAWADGSSLIPLLSGLLAGHFFWPRYRIPRHILAPLTVLAAERCAELERSAAIASEPGALSSARQRRERASRASVTVARARALLDADGGGVG